MNKALLDTDIYSEVAKGIDPLVVENPLAYRRTHKCLTLSVISVMEVVQGYQRIEASAKIQKFCRALEAEEILFFDAKAAVLAGEITGKLYRIGRPIGRCDPMIAAVAIVHQLELVTGNISDYQRLIPLGYSLTLVNWRTRINRP